MNDIHKEVLTQNRSYLIENIILDELFYSELVKNKIFTDVMLEEIEALDTESKRVNKMLRMLLKRGPDAYDKFVKILLKRSHGFVATKLKVTEATERFRRSIKQTMRCDNQMTEKLVRNYTKSNMELEKFHEERVDQLTTLREHTTARVKQLENQIKKLQEQHAECTQRTRSLQMELGRQIELIRSLAGRLQEVTGAKCLDLDNIQLKLDQFKNESSTGNIDGFYCYMQQVVTFLANSEMSWCKASRDFLPKITIENCSQAYPRGRHQKKLESYGRCHSARCGKSFRRSVSPINRQCVKSPVATNKRRPAMITLRQSSSLLSKPTLDHAERYDKQSLLQKPVSRHFLLTPPPL